MTPFDPAFLLIPILKAIKPVSSSRPCLWSSLTLPQSDGSVGLFQPLDDMFDEAVPKIVKSVNARTSDGALAIPPISPEDMLSLSRYDCIVNCLNRICDFQSAYAAQFSLSLFGSDCPHVIDKRRCHLGAHGLPLL